MKEIFKKIEGREWDWFGIKERKNHVGRIYTFRSGQEVLELLHGDKGAQTYYSLADLLANKSWCKAVWGDYGENSTAKSCTKNCKEHDGLISNRIAHWHMDWKSRSPDAFLILQRKGEEACIEYIKKTMT